MTHIIERQHPTKPFLVRWFEPKQGQKSFVTRQEAEDFMAIHDAPENLGGSELFRDYADRWNKQSGVVKVPGYVRKVQSVLDNRINPFIGEVPLNKITRGMCKDLMTDEELTPSTAQRIKEILGAVLNEAVRERFIPENPARGIRIAFNPKRAELHDMSYDQLVTISQAFKPEERLMLWLQLGLGVRLGESLACKTSNIIENGTMMRIEEQVISARHDGESILRPCKHRKPGDYRDVPLPSWLLERINQHVAEFGTTDYLFPAYAVNGSWPQKLTHKMKNGAERAGCPKVHFHMLRHMYASTLLTNGIPITDVAAFLGHRSIALTHAVYGHFMPSGNARAREASARAYEALKSSGTSSLEERAQATPEAHKAA